LPNRNVKKLRLCHFYIAHFYLAIKIKMNPSNAAFSKIENVKNEVKISNFIMKKLKFNGFLFTNFHWILNVSVLHFYWILDFGVSKFFSILTFPFKWQFLIHSLDFSHGSYRRKFPLPKYIKFTMIFFYENVWRKR